MQKEYLAGIFEKVLAQMYAPKAELIFEIPKNPLHGDLSTNIAMQLAGKLGKKPREIATEIISKLEYDSLIIIDINIAGAGFINFKFSDSFYGKCLKAILEKGENIGRQELGAGIKTNVEYVSVNPTGLLHLGHGRNAVIGDTVATLLEWLGHNVTREYYFNNAGNQMNNLANSIYARYIQLYFDDSFEFPEDGYRGEYVKEIAGQLHEQHSDTLKEATKENLDIFRIFGEKWCFAKIEKTLKRLKIEQDVFYNEDSLYSEGKIEEILSIFKEKGMSYEKDGAVWLKLSEMGLEDDRVIVKSTGEPTYRLPDIAYHREKFRRGFELIIDVFGSDHIATVPDVLAGVEALGYDKSKVAVLIHQFVTLTEGGEQVKMSKRTGKNYTLDDLLDEVGEDVVRFFLIMRAASTHLEFDLTLAREQSEKNPVFYLQYAHARICSIFDMALQRGIEPNIELNKISFTHESEFALIKKLIIFEELVRVAGRKYEPHILADYLRELAGAFHVFYHNCRIIGESDEVMNGRFALAEATQKVIKNGLTILGVTAPERM